MYLWDAHGETASWAGVSDDFGRACQAAEECMADGAVSARIVTALLATSTFSLQDMYARTGIAWRARRVCGEVRWEEAHAGEAVCA